MRQIMSSLDSVNEMIYGFARRNNLTIEARHEFDVHGQEEYEASNFVPAYQQVKFMDRNGLVIKVRFVYTD